MVEIIKGMWWKIEVKNKLLQFLMYL
jgi:hypothetical protein